MNLNNEQKEAVMHIDSPLLIIAGAGTGKTTVIVEKIKYLIKNQICRPEEILALTFTEKAAEEMETRVDEAMPYGLFQMSISTFHSFCDHILRTHASYIGYNPDYTLMTTAETLSFLKNHLYDFDLSYFRPRGNPTKFLTALTTHFDRLRDEDITPAQYQAYAKKCTKNPELEDEVIEQTQELAQAYTRFQELKITEGKMDFADLITGTLTLLRKRPSLLKYYQTLYASVLIDEFQDTNIAQYALMKLLVPARAHAAITAVGDDSQAIYKFRGASVSNILQFSTDYPKTRIITLKHNYRSNQYILDSAYRLIRHNDPDTLEARLGISKELIAPKKGNTDSVQLYIGDTQEQEIEAIISEITRQIKTNPKRRLSDFAILCRANKHAEPMLAAFLRAGIAYHVWGQTGLYSRPEVKDLIAYLSIIGKPTDSTAFYRILSLHLFSLKHRDITHLLQFAKTIARSLFEATEIYTNLLFYPEEYPQYEPYRNHLPLLSKRANNTLKNLVEMIARHMEQIPLYSAGQILYGFLEETGYLKILSTPKTADDEKKALHIAQFFNKLKQLETAHQIRTVFEVNDYLGLSAEMGESPAAEQSFVHEQNAVSVLTVHGAKGLEFPIVFIINLVTQRFPATRRSETLPVPQELIAEELPENDYHTLEERRLFYVALTRAKEQVFLTAAKRYDGGVRIRKLSPFITEALGEQITAKEIRSRTDRSLQLTIEDFAPKKKGQLFTHPDPKEESVVRSLAQQKRSFSYSQLDTFTICPLRFKYQYLVQIPTTVSPAAAFGESIHRALQRFYQVYIQSPAIGEKELIEMFRANWVPIGYDSARHEEETKKTGENMLKNYIQHFHSHALTVIDIEKAFRIKIDTNTYLSGKIDRIDDLGNGIVEIIDYKTGKVPNEKKQQSNLQLPIYALAASEKGFLPHTPKKTLLSLIYLSEMKKISAEISPDTLVDIRKQIRTKADEIRESTFSAKPGPWCGFCEFRMICDASPAHLRIR